MRTFLFICGGSLSQKLCTYLFFCSSVFIDLLYGPRQLFLFQCGLKMPKGWTPPESLEILFYLWNQSGFFSLLILFNNVEIFHKSIRWSQFGKFYIAQTQLGG